MTGKINYGKIAVVIFITALIWIWTDLALDEEYPVPRPVSITVSETDPNIWVNFDGGSTASVKKVVLKGSASRIAEVRRRLNDGSLVLNFFFDPEQEGMTKAGESYPLDVLSFLKKSDQLKQLGLTVESCEPKTVQVNVTGLVEKSLEVRCIDRHNNAITAGVEPAKVNMFVPEDWQGIATILLTREEREQAMVAPIKKKPYVELMPGVTKEVPTTVKITSMPEEDRLDDFTITAVSLGITLSTNLQGKYDVEITDPETVRSSISIRSTPEAKRAYENMRYQVTLEIYDDDLDLKSTEPLRRELVYNFPAEYVRNGEIELKHRPVEARFKLIPLPSGQVVP